MMLWKDSEQNDEVLCRIHIESRMTLTEYTKRVNGKSYDEGVCFFSEELNLFLSTTLDSYFGNLSRASKGGICWMRLYNSVDYCRSALNEWLSKEKR